MVFIGKTLPFVTTFITYALDVQVSLKMPSVPYAPIELACSKEYLVLYLILPIVQWSSQTFLLHSIFRLTITIGHSIIGLSYYFLCAFQTEVVDDETRR